MRIAFVIDSFPKRTETFVRQQADSLIERGHEVEIFGNLERGDDFDPGVASSPLMKSFHDYGVPGPRVLRVPKASLVVARESTRHPRMILEALNVRRYGRRALALRMPFEVATITRRRPFDLVHAHFGPNGVRALRLRALGVFDAPVITSFYGYDISRYQDIESGEYERLFTDGDAFFAICEHMKKRLIELGCPAERIVIRRLGVDGDMFHDRERIPSTNGVVRIASVARLIEKKGIDRAIDAVARLKREGLSVEYVVIGDGPLRGELNRRVRERGIEGVTVFRGWRPHAEVVEALRSVDIFVLPCVRAEDGDEDGTPVAVLEAMASGIPIVTTRTVGLSEMVEDGSSGFLVEPDDDEALATRLRQLCESPEMRLRFGEKGRAKVLEVYNRTALGDASAQLYDEVLRRWLSARETVDSVSLGDIKRPPRARTRRRRPTIAHPHVDLDLTGQEFKNDPYPVFRELRDKLPLCRVMSPEGDPVWLVTRYDDVAKLLVDSRLGYDRTRARGPSRVPRIFAPISRLLMNVDPPDHTRLRGLVQDGFTADRVARMQERIEEITNRLMDGFESREVVDLISDFAGKLPAMVIAEMLGVPARDHEKIRRWSIIAIGSWRSPRTIPSVIAFTRYIRRLVRMKRARPDEGLVSVLANVSDGDRLNEDELTSLIFLLLVAGHVTTIELIGNSALALLDHPEQASLLRSDPEILGGTGIEELLRYESPTALSQARFALEDFVSHDFRIRRGERVQAVLASANRDEREFPAPDTLDLRRKPNRHVAFGKGIHYCLGAGLARLEGVVAIQSLLTRFPGLRLAVPREKLQWKRMSSIRGLESLPVSLE